MDAFDLQIRNHVYAAFVGEGRAQTTDETAAALELAEDEVAAAYRRLDDAHALVEAGGRSWFANCAWDALGIPASLNTFGSVSSECPDCGEPVELEVRDGELVRGAQLLVHFVVPARRWWDDIAFT